GFDLAGGFALGCTIGMSMESQILPSPTWAIQRRGLTTNLRIEDPATGTVHHDFFLNTFATLDFNGETLGLGYYTWPMPVWFLPFTTTSHQAINGILPQGPVTLIFDVILKPGITVDDFTDDLIVFGNVASDYSWTDFPTGQTWLLWSSAPMLSPIDSVIVP
ncbi:MAG: hypothetical protein AAF657_37235, partial [Acidobacteriota bacterium]